MLKDFRPFTKDRRVLVYSSFTGAKAGMALFHLSNRANWEINCERTFWHAMDMKFSYFLKEFRELRIERNERDSLGFCPGMSHSGAASRCARQIARGGRCLNNCVKASKYRLHNTVQYGLQKALNGLGTKAICIEAHPYATESERTDITVFRTDAPTVVECYVDVTVTNAQQTTIPTVKKLSVEDNIICCENLLTGQYVVKNHIFSATQKKIQKYKGCHENARRNGSHSNPVIVPFAVDTQGNLCSVAILFLKSMAKLKFKDMPGDKRMKDLAQSNWVSETCRNIQVQVIKTTAFNNRLALKSSFGMDYNKLFPGSIFNPPSYSENFISSSSEG